MVGKPWKTYHLALWACEELSISGHLLIGYRQGFLLNELRIRLTDTTLKIVTHVLGCNISLLRCKVNGHLPSFEVKIRCTYFEVSAAVLRKASAQDIHKTSGSLLSWPFSLVCSALLFQTAEDSSWNINQSISIDLCITKYRVNFARIFSNRKYLVQLSSITGQDEG